MFTINGLTTGKYIVTLLIRTLLVGIIAVAVYLLTASQSVPQVLGLGEVRVLLVVIAATLIEEVFYIAVKYSIPKEENK